MALEDRQRRGKPAEKSFYSTGEVAKMLGVTSRTVSNWCDQGRLPYMAMPSGHRRIPASAIKGGLDYDTQLRTFRERMARKLDGAAALSGEEIAEQIRGRRQR